MLSLGITGGEKNGNAQSYVSTDLGRRVSIDVYRGQALGGVSLGLSLNSLFMTLDPEVSGSSSVK